jgi:hypothetical protein
VAEFDADDSNSTSLEPKPAPGAPQAPQEAAAQFLGSGARSLAALSLTLGWGLTILGVIAAILALLDPLPSPASTLVAHVGRGVRAAWLILAFGLAGWAAACLLRMMSSLVVERLERDSRRSAELGAALNQAVRVLERIAAGVEQRGEAGGFEPAASLGRTRAASEIEAAIRDAKWPLAESLLDAFETTYAGDPKSSSLRQSLASARRSVLQNRMAELAAARQVSDPARVLELFSMVAPELEAETRVELQSEVAQWFLTLIYRRLRTGKIQVEVVELAGQFARTFAATTEGASVMAALPTLRRSAGLCPKCGQPYTGVDQACPDCLRPGGKPAAAPPPSTNSIPME